tara:strand:- start:880 stop:1620 length:741 start_codon:yes stop_codon:yes gene_type:complete
MKQDGFILLLAKDNLALTKECLKSLRAQTVPCELLVINNASSDGTKQWLRTQRGIRVMTFEEQRSVAACWNEGMRWAWSQGYTEVLSVNNDTELLPETYQTLSDWAAADDGRTTGMVTCVSRREREELAYERPFTSRPNPDFSCYLLQRWAWEKVGGFDEDYLIAFGEDCRFHAESWRKGIRCECISLPFLHHGSQTIKQADEIERRRIGRQADKNRELFYQTYGERIGTEGYDRLFTAETFGVEL